MIRPMNSQECEVTFLDNFSGHFKYVHSLKHHIVSHKNNFASENLNKFVEI